MTMTVNAGHIDRSHWVQDPEIGGGRIIGEGCHFIDLLSFISGSPVVEVYASAAELNGQTIDDVVSINLKMADGSLGTVHYLANGNKKFSKERLEVFWDEKIISLDNFKSVTSAGLSLKGALPKL